MRDGVGVPPRKLPSGWRLFLYFAVADGVPSRSLRVALLVGTTLNLINQGDAIFGGRPLNWVKLCLTFAMPYVVSTYGAVTVRIRTHGKEADGEPKPQRGRRGGPRY